MRRLPTVMVMLAGFMSVGSANSWKLDKAHSQIGFTITHMMISEVTGKFRDFNIAFESSRTDFSDASVEAVIRAGSLSTDHDRRDAHLKSEDFFHVEQFPEIRFNSTSFEKSTGNTYKIVGVLTLRGITKQVAFDAEHRGTLKTSRGMLSAWRATLEINRYDFGLRWNRAIEAGGFTVGETVKITLNLEFTKS